MPSKFWETVLGRGWAGKTITRADTVERLNPLIRQFLKLNHNYQYVIRSHSERAVTEALQRVQKSARADVGKLSETVLSCGGSPENGTDMQAEDFDLGTDEVEMLSQLKDLEADFNENIAYEREEIPHQMRTRGILEAVRSNSTERLDLLDALIERAKKATQ